MAIHVLLQKMSEGLEKRAGWLGLYPMRAVPVLRLGLRLRRRPRHVPVDADVEEEEEQERRQQVDEEVHPVDVDLSDG